MTVRNSRISREEFEKYTVAELAKKYGLTERHVAILRLSLGFPERPRGGRPKPKVVSEELAKVWVRLYVEDGLNAQDIKLRFPGWGVARIRETIRERIGALYRGRCSSSGMV